LTKLRKKMLFHRNYQAFAGGHLKVFDYFRHTQAAGGYAAEIYVTPNSRPDHPWRGETSVVAEYQPEEADVLFIAGMDWQALDAHPGIQDRIPVINLIQHVRHASPGHPLFRFLSRRATRICVSAQVAAALRATGACNGPVHAIPNGIDRTLLPPLDPDPECDVFICGIKQRYLARRLANRVRRQGLSVDCLTAPVLRPDFLIRMSRARTVVLLPHVEEGFYLPALEAMSMGCVVICPDCIGNRAFCIDEVTALVPDYNAAAIEAAVARIARDPGLAATLRVQASSASRAFDIGTERAAYHQLLREAA
jgi:hypothetical protein